MKAKSINAIADFLQASELNHLQTKITRIQAINQCLQKILPQDISLYCQAANFDGQTLILSSTKSTITTKLNFMLPAIIKELKQMGYPNIEKAKVIIARDTPKRTASYWPIKHSQVTQIGNLKKLLKDK